MEQDQSSARRRCPVCGEDSEGRARYCWNCGARFGEAPTPFNPSLAEVVPEAAVELPAPADAASVVPAESGPSVAPAWTAPSDVWTAAASATASPTMSSGAVPVVVAPPKKGVGRTLWIVLGILAFIILFCCVASIILVVVSSRDSAFQNQVSFFAQARQ